MADHRATIIVCVALCISCGGTAARPAQPPPAPAPAAAVPPDPSRVKGRLDPVIIQRLVRANFGGMKKCYEEGLARDPKLQGKLSTRFVIERDGHVSSAMDNHETPPADPSSGPLGEHLEASRQHDLQEPRFPDAKVVECVAARFAALSFPKPEGGIVTVVYPIVFAPGD